MNLCAIFKSSMLVFGKNLNSKVASDVLNSVKASISGSLSRTATSGVVRIEIDDRLTREVPVAEVNGQKSSEAENLSTGAVVGVAVAMIALVGTVIFLAVYIRHDILEQQRQRDILLHGDVVINKDARDRSAVSCLHRPSRMWSKLWMSRRGYSNTENNAYTSGDNGSYLDDSEGTYESSASAHDDPTISRMRNHRTTAAHVRRSDDSLLYSDSSNEDYSDDARQNHLYVTRVII
jgi:hypothetical protein